MKLTAKLLLLVVIPAVLLAGCGQSQSGKAASAEASPALSAAGPGTSGSDTGAEPAAAASSSGEDKAVAAAASSGEDKANISWKTVESGDLGSGTYYLGFRSLDNGIAVGYAGNVYYTSNGGKTWLAGENSSLCRFGLDIIDAETAYSCGNGGHVRVTKNGGKTWEECTSFGDAEPNACKFVSFIDKKTGWIAAAAKNFAVTADGAVTWEPLEFPQGIGSVIAIELRTVKKGYILDDNGILFTTGDGGKSWSRNDLSFGKMGVSINMLKGGSVPNAAIRFTDENNGIISFIYKDDSGLSHLDIMKTSDGCKTWENETIPPAASAAYSAVYLSRDGKLMTLLNDKKFDVMTE